MSVEESRIIALEEKYLHQSELLNELNLIVAGQQRVIERLLKDIQSIQETGEGELSAGNTKDDIPPHY